MTTIADPSIEAGTRDGVPVRLRVAVIFPTLQDVGQYLSTIADLCALASVTFKPEHDEALTRFHEARRSDFVAGLMFGAASNLRVVRIRLASPLEALLVAISPPATILAASRIITMVRDWAAERSIGRDRARLVTALVDQAVHDLNANESGVIADVLSNGLLERLMALPPTEIAVIDPAEADEVARPHDRPAAP